MPFDLQPTLEGELLELRPLRAADFDNLFAVAADFHIWEQHPDKDRYEEERFRTFFREALESGGALVAIDTRDRRIIGSSRFHGYDGERARSRSAGRSWPARTGVGLQRRDEATHASPRVQVRDRVVLLVGPPNLRSRRAVEKIGGVRVGSRRDARGHDSIVYEITASRYGRI